MNFDHIELLVSYLHTDPELLMGVPTNQELIANSSNPLLKDLDRDLSPGERQGFLEMWRTSFVSHQISRLTDGDLLKTEAAARDELYSQTATEGRALDLRFIFIKVGMEKAARFYSS